MATKITREILESYLNCKTKAHLKLAGQQGTKSDYEGLLEATRQEVRQKAISTILGLATVSLHRAQFRQHHKPAVVRMGSRILAMTVTAGSIAEGRTLRELDMRGLTGATVLALLRADEQHVSPRGDQRLEVGDVIAVAGTHEAVAGVRSMVSPPSQTQQ